MPDLWPPDFGNSDKKPPVSILREQAEYLEKKTKGLLRGLVMTAREGDKFVHQFMVCAPLLDNYTYHLFTVKHAIYLYPLEIAAHVTRQIYPDVQDEPGFQKLLFVILNSDETKQVIRSLLIQSQAEPDATVFGR